MDFAKVGYFKQRNGQPAYVARFKGSDGKVYGGLWSEKGWVQTSWTRGGDYCATLGPHSRDLVDRWVSPLPLGVPPVEDNADRETLDHHCLAKPQAETYEAFKVGEFDVPLRKAIAPQSDLDDLVGWRLHRPHREDEVRFLELVKCVNIENGTGHRFVETFSGHAYSAEMLAQLGMWASVAGQWDKPTPGYSHPTRCRRLYTVVSHTYGVGSHRPPEAEKPQYQIIDADEAKKNFEFARAYSRPQEKPRSAAMVMGAIIDKIGDVSQRKLHDVQVIACSHEVSMQNASAVKITLTTGQKYLVIVKESEDDDAARV